MTRQVLHIDRNEYYGGESASLNLEQMYEKFKGKDAKPDESKMGRSRDYNIDLIPKFIMANGTHLLNISFSYMYSPIYIIIIIIIIKYLHSVCVYENQANLSSCSD